MIVNPVGFSNENFDIFSQSNPEAGKDHENSSAGSS
jgi:hypothetical protein